MKMFKKKIKPIDTALMDDINKLKEYNINSDERKALGAEIQILKDAKSVQDEASNRKKETVLKGFVSLGVAVSIAILNNKFIMDSKWTKFIPHI